MQSFGKTYSRLFSKQFDFPWFLIPIAVLAVSYCFSVCVSADSDGILRETAQRLAERVAAIPGLHGALRLEWHADTDWPRAESAHWQEIVREEFEKRSLSLTEDSGASALDVFVAETPTNVVLTAKTHVSDREEVRIVAVARALLPQGSLPMAPVKKCQPAKPAETGKSLWRAETLLTSPCDGSSWKLRSSESEPNANEVLQVAPDGTSRESSAAVLSEFPGPIVAINGEQNPGSALVVAQNLRTGNYEIYKITLACGN